VSLIRGSGLASRVLFPFTLVTAMTRTLEELCVLPEPAQVQTKESGVVTGIGDKLSFDSVREN
jgi:hypothetical protein